MPFFLFHMALLCFFFIPNKKKKNMVDSSDLLGFGNVNMLLLNFNKRGTKTNKIDVINKMKVSSINIDVNCWFNIVKKEKGTISFFSLLLKFMFRKNMLILGYSGIMNFAFKQKEKLESHTLFPPALFFSLLSLLNPYKTLPLFLVIFINFFSIHKHPPLFHTNLYLSFIFQV